MADKDHLRAQSKHCGVHKFEPGPPCSATENSTTPHDLRRQAKRHVTMHKPPRTPLSELSTTPLHLHPEPSKCTSRHKPLTYEQACSKSPVRSSDLATATPQLERTLPHQAYSIPAQPRHRTPLQSSHRKAKRRQRMGVSAKPDTLELLLEGLVLSTSKSKHSRERLTPPTHDPVKLNLEAKLNEATETTHPMNKTECRAVGVPVYYTAQKTNFYELEEELVNIDWELDSMATPERCRQPVAWLLNQHYFVPLSFEDQHSKIAVKKY